MEETVIYFILDRRSAAMKIGVAADPSSRLVDLQIGNANPLELVGAIPGDLMIESALHRVFAERCIRGEWFRVDNSFLCLIYLLLGTPESAVAALEGATFSLPIPEVPSRVNVACDWLRLALAEGPKPL